MSNIRVDGNAFAKWLKERMLEKNWNLTHVAEELHGKVTLRTLSRIQCAQGQQYRRWDTVSDIAELFGRTVQQVLDEVNNDLELPTERGQKKLKYFEIMEPWDDFRKLSDTVLRADHVLLKNFRNLGKIPAETLFQGYETSLKGSLLNSEMSISELLDLLANRSYLSRILSTLPSTSMVVRVEKYLKSIAFGFENSVLLIHNPHLLWDCHCKTPTLREFDVDAIPYSAKDCPIHGNEYGNQIDDHFKRSLIEIEYGNLSFLWKRSDEFWPPSMDTFTMLLDLEKASVFNHNYSTVLDLGCGTGIIGITAAKRIPRVISIALADWLLTPLVYTALNWIRNIPDSTQTSAILRVGLDTRWIMEPKFKRFDLAVCNPPYLPIPEQFRDLKMSSTVAGTGLLERFIQHSAAIAEDCYVSFSHLALEEAKASEKLSRKRLIPIAEPRKVPFRIIHAFENVRYLKWLVKERKLRYEPRSRHRFWHFLTTYKIESL